MCRLGRTRAPKAIASVKRHRDIVPLSTRKMVSSVAHHLKLVPRHIREDQGVRRDFRLAARAGEGRIEHRVALYRIRATQKIRKLSSRCNSVRPGASRSTDFHICTPSNPRTETSSCNHYVSRIGLRIEFLRDYYRVDLLYTATCLAICSYPCMIYMTILLLTCLEGILFTTTIQPTTASWW